MYKVELIIVLPTEKIIPAGSEKHINVHKGIDGWNLYRK